VRKYPKTYVVKHGRGWKYKRAIPRDLQAILRKKVWTRYLGDTGRAEAEIAARKLAVEHDDLVRDLRSLTPAERQTYAEAGGNLEGLEANAQFWSEYAPSMRKTADALDGVTLEMIHPPGMTEEQLAMSVLEARRHAKDVEQRASSQRKVLGKLSPGKQMADLESLIQVWVDRNKPRSNGTMRLHVRRFVAVVGNLCPSSVTRNHVGAFRDVLERDATLSRRTVSKHLDSLHALFRAAHSALLIDSNPAAGIKISKAGGKFSDESRKVGFTAEQARAIFVAAESMNEDFEWMTKLCAHTGARSGELAQLRVEDVTVLEGVPVLCIHDKHGPIKNRFAVRDIPIPPPCAGIVAYAASRPGPWLFDYPAHKARSRGKTFQHVASRFLRHTVKIATPAVTWHSWRHRFRTLCRTLAMPSPVSKSLMGHALGAGEHDEYGEKPPLAVQLEWISKIDPLK
jgi:integrase